MLLAAMKKQAKDEPRGAGQRLFEGSYGGAGKGMMGGTAAGGLLGALLGGYAGYKGSQQTDDIKEKILRILAGVAAGGLGGAATGGAAGTGIGGALGGIGSTLFGSRKQQPTY